MGLSASAIRASWEADRDHIRRWCIKEKKFTPMGAEKFVRNFIDSMTFAGIPSTSREGINAAYREWLKQNDQL